MAAFDFMKADIGGDNPTGITWGDLISAANAGGPKNSGPGGFGALPTAFPGANQQPLTIMPIGLPNTDFTNAAEGSQSTGILMKLLGAYLGGGAGGAAAGATGGYGLGAGGI